MRQMIRCELANAQKGVERLQLTLSALINGIYFSMLWALAPILVTLVSFFW